ncbi:hypothetical protein NYP18_08960 [Corynebacterium sp. YIM 101645]|uniref:Secreted protein n=1 Tax=Corynebacterium lemuris TaxID=1859292 RepID=A0ABT2FX16_9CORY|nr:hypothetical protein [Corynebacterium lemuris]MCS5479788.1 hypothetical protein [Corynebacterium lemuris]
MTPDQNKFHDPRRRKWLGGLLIAVLGLGTALWVILLAGLGALAWKTVIG